MGEAKQLTELALDGNPIFHNKSYIDFCLKTCPNLKHLDLKKISPDILSEGKTSTEGDKKVTTSSGENSTETPEKKKEEGKTDSGVKESVVTTAANTDEKKNLDALGDDISPENLLEVISQEWKQELERLRQKGLNGYRRRKESRHESLVQSGHAEIEGDTLLFIYGNALEVLNNSDF